MKQPTSSSHLPVLSVSVAAYVRVLVVAAVSTTLLALACAALYISIPLATYVHISAF